MSVENLLSVHWVERKKYSLVTIFCKYIHYRSETGTGLIRFI